MTQSNNEWFDAPEFWRREDANGTDILLYPDYHAMIAEATRRAKLETWGEIKKLVDRLTIFMSPDEEDDVNIVYPQDILAELNSRIQQYGTKE